MIKEQKKEKIGLWYGKEIEKLGKKELLEIIRFLGKERDKVLEKEKAKQIKPNSVYD